MLAQIILAVTLTLSFGEVNDSGGENQLQEAAAGYAKLEHRLDDLQNRFLQLFTSMEKAEQAKLEGQRLLLEQLQKGISVQLESTNMNRVIEDCMQAGASGRYLLRPAGTSRAFPVYCEAESFGGGWLVIQQRIDGTVKFNRDWSDYRKGFGSVDQYNEFWLGLEKMHRLTKYASYELAVEIKNETGHYGYALHTNFRVAAEDDGYQLFLEFSFLKGTLGSKMMASRYRTFSTPDKDNTPDQLTKYFFPEYESGWWYHCCDHTNLNGPYRKDPKTGRGIYWEGFSKAATYTRMMIRRG